MKNVTVGECKTGKKKKQSSKALEENASLEKKKTKVKSLGKCYRWNLKKSGDGKDIIKKD